jgi:hypothetical protein
LARVDAYDNPDQVTDRIAAALEDRDGHSGRGGREGAA